MDTISRIMFAVSLGPQGRGRLAKLQAAGGVESKWSGFRTRGGPAAERSGPEIHIRVAEELTEGSAAPDPAEGVRLWFGQRIRFVPVMASEPAGGLMINMTDVDPAHEDEFNEWYDSEHLDRLSREAGLLSAARYKVIHGAPAYVAIYRVTRPDVVQTTSWVTASMTPWTRRIGRFRSNNERWVLTPAP